MNDSQEAAAWAILSQRNQLYADSGAAKPPPAPIQSRASIVSFIQVKAVPRGERLQIYAEETSAQGVLHWLSRRKKTVYRALFLLIWLAGAAGTLVQLVNTFLTFAERETVMSVSEGAETERALPAISICPYNGGFQKSKYSGSAFMLSVFGGSEERMKRIMAACFDPAGRDPIPSFEVFFGLLLQRHNNSYYDMAMDSLQIPTSEVFLDCSLGEERIPCESVLLVRFSESGICYTVNFNGTFPLGPYSFARKLAPGPPHLIKAKRAVVGCLKRGKKSFLGHKAGLKLRLNANVDEYCHSELEEKRSHQGFNLLLHDQNTLPVMGLDHMVISPGFRTRVSVEESLLDRAAMETLGQCSSTAQNELFEAIPYTKQSCETECVYEEIWRNCSCVPPYVAIDHGRAVPILNRRRPVPLDQRQSVYPENPICFGNAAGTRCMKDVMQGFKLGSLRSDCHLLTRCPNQCLQRRFESTSSKAEFPPPRYAGIVSEEIRVRNNLTMAPDKVNRNIAELEVFFRELRLVVMEIRPLISVSVLFARLGGDLGLFLGASLFMFVELVSLTADLLTGWRPNRAL